MKYDVATYYQENLALVVVQAILRNGLGLMSNPGLERLIRLWVRPAYCLAVVWVRERTLVPMPGSLRGRPSRGRAGSPAVGAVGGRVVHPQPVCAAAARRLSRRPAAVFLGD